MSNNSKPKQYFLKIKGSIIINNCLQVPATFVVLFGAVHSFFIFSNISVNKDDKIICLFPENIKFKGSILNTGELPNSAFKLIEPYVYKSIINIDSDLTELLAYSKELFRKEYTFVI
jgi:hypothetical protein